MAAFLFMNPGNGIETENFVVFQRPPFDFLFMNPGNGIETFNVDEENDKIDVSYL